MEFELEIVRGVPVIRDGGNVILIDTGSPFTIHRAPSLTFGGKTYSCLTSVMGHSIEQIAESLNHPVTTLMGTDILVDHQVVFDYARGKVTFNPPAAEWHGTPYPISLMIGGLPTITLEVGGSERLLALDTGAEISYLSPSLTQNYEPVGTAEDFHPLIGKFSTPRFHITTTLDGHSFPVTYGKLPPILQWPLTFTRLDGVIGYDLFRHFTVMLELQSRTFKYRYVGLLGA